MREFNQIAVRLLLDNSSNVNIKYAFDSAAIRSRKKGSETTVKLLLENGADTESQAEYGRSALSYAPLNGHEPVARLLLLENGANVESKDEFGYPMLLFAVLGGNDTIFELLEEYSGIEQGEDTRTLYGHHLGTAAMHGCEAIARMLHKTGARIDVRDASDGTLLSLASGFGKTSIIELLLLDNNADIGSGDDMNRSPLAWTAHEGEVNIVDFLLEKGADVEARDTDGITLAQLAVENGHENVAMLLKKEPRPLRKGCILRLRPPKALKSLHYTSGSFFT
ncbi:ankyrin repeat protein [Penicillium argentinense]|uniref:Ankyrin repeat protein n=1 Tax=Penicillium argentinense TaxID=1131581 RepID=A0A9W9G3K2_9EURO|nr:ankyrin repeat protein [Penicillium argentinense]KAJ5110632.1 ankyrin repeat protein [Penicillium argentinense]